MVRVVRQSEGGLWWGEAGGRAGRCLITQFQLLIRIVVENNDNHDEILDGKSDIPNLPKKSQLFSISLQSEVCQLDRGSRLC